MACDTSKALVIVDGRYVDFVHAKTKELGNYEVMGAPMVVCVLNDCRFRAMIWEDSDVREWMRLNESQENHLSTDISEQPLRGTGNTVFHNGAA